MRSRHTRSSHEADTLVASHQHCMQCLWLARGWIFFSLAAFGCTTSFVFFQDPRVAFLSVIILRNPARDAYAAHFTSFSFGCKSPLTIMTFIASDVLKSHNNNFAPNECRNDIRTKSGRLVSILFSEYFLLFNSYYCFCICGIRVCLCCLGGFASGWKLGQLHCPSFISSRIAVKIAFR